MPSEFDESHTQPLGTSPGVFWQEECSVVAQLDLLQKIELVFDDEETASNIMHRLHCKLLIPDEVSIHLRNRHSVDTMLAFLERFIPRNDVRAVRWLARIRLTSDGLEFEMPDGEWTEIEHESVSATYNWETIPPHTAEQPPELAALTERMKTMSRRARTAFAHFQLPCHADWQGVGRVFRADGMSLWFPDDTPIDFG